jgi:hypothetical protein
VLDIKTETNRLDMGMGPYRDSAVATSRDIK